MSPPASSPSRWNEAPSRVPIPRSLNEITPEWLTAALREGTSLSDVTVKDCRVCPLGETVGATGIYADVSITFDRSDVPLPTRMFAKMLHISDQIPDGANVPHQYPREIRVYRDLGSRLGVRVPRMYYGAADEAEPAGLLLLDYLGHGRQGSTIEGCGASDATLVLRALASQHARWWNSAELADMDWLLGFDDESSFQPTQLAFERTWQSGLARKMFGFGPYSVEVATKLLGRVAALGLQLMHIPLTLVQVDCGLDNIFFMEGDHGPEVVFFDWGAAARGVGPYDVHRFLSTGFNDDGRGDGLDLPRAYHSELVRLGVDAYPSERFLCDYRLAVLFGFAYTVGLLELVNRAPADSPLSPMRMDQIGRYCRLVERLDCLELLED